MQVRSVAWLLLLSSAALSAEGQTCEQVWNAQACDVRYGGCSTCGRRINWLKSARGMSDAAARKSVADTFPEECGPCGPGAPQPAPRPAPGLPGRAPSQPVAGDTLKAMAAQRGLLYGAAVNGNRLNQDGQLRAVAQREFSVLTAENGCKHSWLQPNRGQFSWGQCDTVLQFAEANNMLFRGHALIWGNSAPGWLNDGGFSGQQKAELLRQHVRTVASRYGERAYCWDVVNEAVLDQPPNNGNGPLENNLKRNVWFPSVRNYIDLAFQEAREAAGPNVKLFYNDYNMAFAGGKVNAVYNMLKSMKDRGVPVDGMGLQLHIDDGTNTRDLAGNVRRFASLGLEIHFTEVTVECLAPCRSFRRQAEIYAELLQLCLDTPNCKSFQTWGVTDKYIWNGAERQSLPWDGNFNQKDAYRALFNTL